MPIAAAAAATSASSGASESIPSGISSQDMRRGAAIVPVTELSDELLRSTVTSVFGDSVAVASPAGPSWDIEVESYEDHDRVVYYVRLFTGSGRDRFVSRLTRGTQYEPMIRSRFREAGLPEDLVYIALIESGFDPDAYSRAAAVGMWQFMTSTAKGVGLRVDWWMDERRDPSRSTDAAIRYLSDLKRQFGSLYLAAAAYNGGPGRVSRGLTRFAEEMEGAEGEDRFFALAQQTYLHSETKNYVPQLIAAALVAKDPQRYGVVVDTMGIFSYDSLLVPPATSLAAVAVASGAEGDAIRSLNPAILRGISPPDASIWVRIPLGSGEWAAEALDSMSDETRHGFRTVKANGKQSVATLAKNAGISSAQLRSFNPGLRVASKTGIPVAGQSIRVPLAATLAYARNVPDPSVEKGGGGAVASSVGTHVVRAGESLSVIGKRYGISVARLKALNGLKSDKIRIGQKLRIRS